MRTYLAALVVACIAAAALTPMVRRLALRLGAVSHPGGRHVHSLAMPRLGGVAIYLAFLSPMVALFFVNSSVALITRQHAGYAVGLLAGATAMTAVGVIDDTRGLRAQFKLAAQLAVAALAFACGFRIDIISLPVVGNLSMGIFALPVTLLWITGIINAVNLIDGLDGLAAGVVLFAAITNLVVATIADSVFIAVVMASVIGAVLGFLVFNFNPARIFMGDSGSYLLGYVLATGALAGGTSQKASTAVSLLVPCLALGVPIFDTLFSMVRRFLERRPLFSPDRGHIHHRLLDVGLTHRRAVLTIYAVSLVFSAAAIAASMGKDWQVGVALLASSVVLFALVRFAGYFGYLQNQLRRGRMYSVLTRALRRSIPELAEKLAAAGDDDQLRDVLREAGVALGMKRLALVDHEDSGGRLGSSGTRQRDDDGVELVIAIGTSAHARADLVVAWAASDGPASQEMGVLLSVVGDFVERALVRIGSAMAPGDAPAPAAVQDSSVGHSSRVAIREH